MLSYKQFEREIFNYLYQKHLCDKKFTFSVRKIPSVNAKNDYFNGTEKAGYSTFTLWKVPVSYKGASIYLVAFVLSIKKGEYRCRWQYHISKDVERSQEKSSIKFGKILRKEMERIRGIKDHNSRSVFKFSQEGFTSSDLNIFFSKLDNYINKISKIVQKSIKKAKTKSPAWNAGSFTIPEFRDNLSRLEKRLDITITDDSHELFLSQEEKEIEEIKNLKNIDQTEKDSLIKSRLGQGKFRTDLIDLWHSCAISKIRNLALLHASHIKPWRISNNQERLDKYNGLLLLPNYDTLFDKCLITFQDNGKIIISNKLTMEERSKFGLKKDIKIDVKEKNKLYLSFHRGLFELKNNVTMK